MSFLPLTNPVSYVVIAGKKSPGLAEVRRAGSPRKWDERQSYGNGGASLVFRGVGLSKFEIVISLYSEQDWADWHEWRPIVQRAPIDNSLNRARVLGRQATDAATRARELREQELEVVGIAPASMMEERRSRILAAQARQAAETRNRPRALEIWHPILEDLGIGSVVVLDVSQPEQVEAGVWNITIQVSEYRQPTPSLSRPQGSESARSAPVLDEYDQRIVALTSQLQELAQ